jgi:hypothetical protein
VVVIARGPVRVDRRYQRVELLQRLGRDTVAATVWALPEAEALVARHQLATTTATALEQGWLLARLQGQGLAQEELARRLCRSKSWVSRRLALVAVLPEEVQARVRAGTVPPQAAMKSLVPLARANRAQCAALATALGRTRVSVGKWRRCIRRGGGPRAGRERVVAEPQLYLKVVRGGGRGHDGEHGLVQALRHSHVAPAARARRGRETWGPRGRPGRRPGMMCNAPWVACRAPWRRRGPMLDQSMRTSILKLHETGHGSRAIARALGVSRVTEVLADIKSRPS